MVTGRLSFLCGLAVYSAPLRLPSSQLCAPIRRSHSPKIFTARSLPRLGIQLQRRLYSSNSTSRPYPRPIPRVRRVLLFTAFSIFFTSAGFLIAASPAIAPVIALMSPPTDKETLSLYQPKDDFASNINSHIVNHPLAQSLRANPAYKELRPHLRIPESQRKHSLTAGTLTGPGRVTVPPLAFVEEGKQVVSISYLSTDMCGHVGMVHGGMLATIMDEGMGYCGLAALPNKIGVTASLTVNYRAPTPAGSFVVLRAEIVKTEGRKVWVKGRIELLGDGIEPGKLLVEGDSLFVEPKYAKAMPRLLTVQ